MESIKMQLMRYAKGQCTRSSRSRTTVLLANDIDWVAPPSSHCFVDVPQGKKQAANAH
jgi:hypothetical protein